MYDLASQHRGLLLNVEHRFYGSSYPILDTKVSSLEYLTSDQALADLARLIDHVKANLSTYSSQVILYYTVLYII
jgi:hypothetical protein